ncbi:MAG: hypothetical protein HY074_00155 [Deltaproteobacteria bacterium]|nr:hypothetical protein [Deltaproteobacteria bacterium]
MPPTLKLPRQVEADPRCESIVELLARNQQPLWEKGTLTVPHLTFLPSLENALKFSFGTKQLERGLEHIDVILNAEQKGQMAVREQKNAAPAYRVSRLLVIPDECTERFYRTCEATLFHHAERVLGIRVNVPYTTFAQSFLGPEAHVKVLLVSERAAVANVLFSLVSP